MNSELFLVLIVAICIVGMMLWMTGKTSDANNRKENLQAYHFGFPTHGSWDWNGPLVGEGVVYPYGGYYPYEYGKIYPNTFPYPYGPSAPIRFGRWGGNWMDYA